MHHTEITHAFARHCRSLYLDNLHSHFALLSPDLTEEQCNILCYFITKAMAGLSSTYETDYQKLVMPEILPSSVLLDCLAALENVG